MEEHGRLPLPPYIKSYPVEPGDYQTVYAAMPGSAAAPTAGLHFTPELLGRLEDAGIQNAYVTLHVGLDTFQPIREQTIEQHQIHREAFSVSREALEVIRSARASGRRLVAVGTTATRVLETLARCGSLDPRATPAPVNGSTDIYITPGYRFRAVDVLLTNFHLPRSTVLALTMAFVGVDRLRRAYAEAIALGYRFYSFGDAMLAEAPGDRPDPAEATIAPDSSGARRADERGGSAA
jgi:S-adenosylmethionine:tRNA ribosyltransferase-isomerase